MKSVKNVLRQRNNSNIEANPMCAILLLNSFQNSRFKSKKSSKIPQQQLSESQSGESSNDDNIPDKQSKVMKINVSSLRVDAVLKSSLGISRNKIDVMFYENRVRVNGEKLPKKNVSICEGDEIDLIKNISPANTDYLIVARIEVLSCVAKENTAEVKIRRYKSLTVENYSGDNIWKE